MLSVETQGKFLWAKLNRPDVRNAFNPQMIAELAALPQQLTPEIRAVVLHGEGTVFSAGGDLNWMRQSLDLDQAQNFEDAMNLARMLVALDRMPVPLVGMIHGAAMGGGVGLVSVCDYVVAHVETQFSFSEARLGIIPACIAPFVLRKIGPGHARALFITAERFSAQKAYDIGLVHQIAQTPEELRSFTETRLQDIAACGPQAARMAKQTIFDLLAQPDDQQLILMAERLASIRVSEEGQEGLRAFLEKRPPKWKKT